MKSKWDGIERRKSLRAAAEALVAKLSPEPMTARPIETLLHELIVHKIELEMQNDELRRTYSALEETRERYMDLFEFAPIGYLTINQEGVISEINLTGCQLLGIARSAAIDRRFAMFIASQDRDTWNRQFINLMGYAGGQKQSLSMKMIRADETMFYAQLDCLRRETQGALPIVRIAFTDNGDVNPA